MSYTNLSKLAQAIRTTLTGLLSTDVVIVDNLSEQSDEESSTTDNRLVMLSIVWGDAFKMQVGENSPVRQFGVAYIRIAVRIGSGTGDAESLGDLVSVALCNNEVNGVVYKTPSPRSEGANGAWWTFLLMCPFYGEITYN